jgi:hypothetical protein
VQEARGPGFFVSLCSELRTSRDLSLQGLEIGFGSFFAAISSRKNEQNIDKRETNI